MKEIFTISTGVNVAKVKPSVKEAKETVIDGDKKTSTNDFFSVVLNHIKESMGTTKEDSKLLLKSSDDKENIKIDLDTKTEQKSLDNHLLEDLLKIISLLKNPDTKTSSFPSLSNKLEKLINSETALKELKSVNNITDLLKLSQKYDLGLEKISVKKLDFETIKKDFPILAKEEFFVAPKKEALKNEKNLVEIKKEIEIKPTILSINNIEKPKTETKKEQTLFEKIMSAPKDNKIEIIKDKIVEDKKVVVATKTTEEVKKTVKITQEEVSKVVVKEEQKEVKTKVIKEDLHVKVDNEIKRPKTSRINEVKIEADIPKKSMVENILQGIKTDKQTTTAKNNVAVSLSAENTKLEKKEKNDTKTEASTNRVDLKPQIKTDTLASKQLNPTRETFSSFAADFKEKLENYKPPFMRVQLALNPKGLGEVDVTIVSRGNNLHVNISSNTNTMTLFTQNQAEFKNSLVNMGFTNLDMNFSNQRENRDQQNGKSSKESSNFFEDENLEEETTSVELIVPQYI